MMEIPLTRNATAIVDDEDYDRLMEHSWALNPEGQGYAVRKGSKRKGEPRTVAMHQEILRVPDGMQIDHINGNGLDNRKANLRPVDVQQNAFNRKKPEVLCTSKYKGVLKRKGKKNWTARIKFNDRHVELGGWYPTEEYAAAAYNFASRIFFGEYRRENPDVPELCLDDQFYLYLKCKRYIERYGWKVNTGTYNMFQHFEKGVVWMKSA